jgi:SAM-dependent methyltransferase
MTQGESKPAPSHSDVKKFYETEYYAKDIGKGSLPWHMKVIAQRLGNLDGKKVLDVACGSGDWLADLAGRGAEVAGIDISSRALGACRARLPDADIREGVAESLPFVDGYFDLVTCLGSLEHFLDQPKALQEMRRVAKKDARFLVLVPNAGFLTRRLGLYKGTDQVTIRETVRPIDDWLQLFHDGGLEAISVWRDLHPLSRHWIANGPIWRWPVRFLQALALSIWPVSWQYQVYFYCRERDPSHSRAS